MACCACRRRGGIRRHGGGPGCARQEVRAASLLAFMLSLPVAFLALVPSGAVSSALFDAIQVISALFPFKPTLDAVDAALNDAGDRGPPSIWRRSPWRSGCWSGCAAPVRLGRCIGIARQVGSGRAEAPAPAQHSLRGPASAAGDAPRPRPHRRPSSTDSPPLAPEDPERTVEAVLHHNLAGYAAAAIESGSLELPAEQARRLARSGVLRVLRARRLRESLAEVEPVIAGACGARPVLLKGPAVADRFYPILGCGLRSRTSICSSRGRSSARRWTR